MTRDITLDALRAHLRREHALLDQRSEDGINELSQAHVAAHEKERMVTMQAAIRRVAGVLVGAWL